MSLYAVNSDTIPRHDIKGGLGGSNFVRVCVCVRVYVPWNVWLRNNQPRARDFPWACAL